MAQTTAADAVFFRTFSESSMHIQIEGERSHQVNGKEDSSLIRSNHPQRTGCRICHARFLATFFPGS